MDTVGWGTGPQDQEAALCEVYRTGYEGDHPSTSPFFTKLKRVGDVAQRTRHHNEQTGDSSQNEEEECAGGYLETATI
jgi:hypothetical protein